MPGDLRVAGAGDDAGRGSRRRRPAIRARLAGRWACRRPRSGMGSRPTKTSGRPESSRAVAIWPMISVGGGRYVGPRCARPSTWRRSGRGCGNGLTTMSPPASQMMSSACAAPSAPPATRSMPDSTPVAEALRDRAPDAPSPPPRPGSPPPRIDAQHDEGARDGLEAVGDVEQPGRGVEHDEQVRPAAPPIPPTCGSAPVRIPASTARTSTRIAIRSNRFGLKSTRGVSAGLGDPAADAPDHEAVGGSPPVRPPRGPC